ncbi:MAG: D-alanyl-D-alanine carboxypeptidase family protein [Erysipelotrichaceae bacterium]
MKKIIVCMLGFLCLSFIPVNAQEPQVGSTIALVQSLDTGEVYYEKNADTLSAPASLTKMMTALVTVGQLEGLDLKTTYVTITQEMLDPLVGTGASVIFFTAGMNLSVYDLLASLMMESAADAAMALEHFITDYTGIDFVELMNTYAQAYGMNDTTFANSTGLDDPNQITTAYDMALLVGQLSESELLTQLIAQPSHVIEMWTTGVVRMTIQNSMIQQMSYMGSSTLQGGKTGFTLDAGYCLATFHNDGTHRYAVVVMKADQSLYNYTQVYYDTQTLSQYAKSAIHETVYFEPNDVVHTIELNQSEETTLDLFTKTSVYASAESEAALKSIQVVYEGPDQIKAPVAYGDEVGYLIVQQGETQLERIPVYAAATHARAASNGILISLLGTYWWVIVLGLVLYVFRSNMKNSRQAYPSLKRRRRF